jgi:DNA-binding transcriptional ArsR family regulator
MAVPRSHRAFCRALLEETRSEMLRWATIDSVAERIGMGYEEAEHMARQLEDAGLVRVGGGHSVMLEEARRQLLKSAAPAGRPRARKRAPARRSRKS